MPTGGRDAMRCKIMPWPSIVAILGSSLVASALTGCQRHGAGRAERPAPLSHVVFASFDPALHPELRARLRRELIDDADRSLRPIPSVVSYAAGEHLDTGRAMVDSAYDVGMYIGFESTAGYSAYVEHPDHVAFVQRWKPRLHHLVVRDVWDNTQ